MIRAPDAALAAALPEHVRAVEGAAAALDGIALDALGAAALMDRVDTKFLLPAGIVADVLRHCDARYRALDVEGRRVCRYHTTYFDTPALDLYHAHHAGRATRRKVRLRTYVDSGESYLEVKLRTGSGRTTKSRLCVPGDPAAALAHPGAPALLDAGALPSPRELREVVDVDYLRLTLVGRDAAERVTLDMMLGFATRDGAASYPGIVVAEVKQERHGRSCFLSAMREFGCRPGSISKYCLGVVSLDARAKTNRYRPVLLRIHETSRRHVLHARTG
jgi:hypothetical protein